MATGPAKALPPASPSPVDPAAALAALPDPILVLDGADAIAYAN
jgi:hypothetical protein